MSGPLSNLPGARDFLWDRLVRGLASFWDNQQRVEIIGIRQSGTDTVVRFRASRATQFVRVHVQATDTYDPNAYQIEARIDCRSNRQQDYTVGGEHDVTIWLIPEFQNPDGSFVRYDGATGNGEDLMAFASIGASKATLDIRDELEIIRMLLERMLIHISHETGIELGPIHDDEV